MFNKPPSPEEKPENKKNQDDKTLGFPSKKLGKDEETVREIFGQRLNPSDLYSMLLILFSENVEKKTPAAVFREYIGNPIYDPSNISTEDYSHIDNFLLSLLPSEFKSIVLSPITPSGSSSVVNNIDPKTMLHTIKNSELISDSSIVLALESARIRKSQGLKGNISEINFATSQRETRMQKFNNPDFSAHYSSFTITSASRDVGRFDFEKRKLAEHLDYFLTFFQKLKIEDKYSIGDITVEISNISIIENLIESGLVDREKITKALRTIGSLNFFDDINLTIPKRDSTMQGVDVNDKFSFLKVPISVLKRFEEDFLVTLKEKFPSVNFLFRLDRSSGLGYFNSLCYKIRVSNDKNETIPLVDGGASDWTGKFLSDNGERFFGSGLGTDILIRKFNNGYEG